MTPYTQDTLPLGDADADASRIDASSRTPAPRSESGEAVRPDAAEGQNDSQERAPEWEPPAESSFFGPTDGGAAGGEASSADWLDRSGPTVPPLDRIRPQRPSQIPRWALVTAGAVALLLVVGATAAAVLPSLGRSAVPRVIGLNVDVARTRLAQDGLKLQIIEHRFSPRPAGLVLVQMPAEGTRIRRSEPVRVVVSAGTEEFTMPDVIGDSQLLAKGILETKGLDVRIETSPSAAASDTVLSTNPGPGQIVHTGDIVRVVIAAAGPSNAVLLPYDLRNVTVVIDPEPVADGQVDIPLDVARRLRSLIEASRGKVIPTRALADTGTAEAAPTRAQRATAGTSTVGIGLSIVSSNPSGVIVFSPIATLPQTVASGKLSASIVSALAVENIVAKRSGAATDTVLGLIKAPWARLQLGSYSSKSDVAAFTDPAWEDSAARGLYRAIGEQYGKKGTAP